MVLLERRIKTKSFEIGVLGGLGAPSGQEASPGAQGRQFQGLSSQRGKDCIATLEPVVAAMENS